MPFNPFTNVQSNEETSLPGGGAALSGDVAKTYVTSSTGTTFAVSGDVADVCVTSSYASETFVISSTGTTFAVSGDVAATYAASGDVANAYVTSSTGTTFAVSGDVAATYMLSGAVTGGGGVTRLTRVSTQISLTSSDQWSGQVGTVNISGTHGMIVKIDVYADWLAGQQSNTTALVNYATSGITPDATTIPYDNDSPTDGFLVGDFIQIDNEKMFVESAYTASNTITVVRGLKNTVPSYHDDNSQIIKLNDGLRFEFWQTSSYDQKDNFFTWSAVMTGAWTTDAEAVSGSHLFTVNGDPSTLTDFGEGDLIYVVDSQSSRDFMIQDVFGDVANADYDYSIVPYDQVDSPYSQSCWVYRKLVFDVPVPFRMDVSGDNVLHYRINVDEAFATSATVYLGLYVDKYA